MKKSNLIILVVAIALVLVGGIYFMSNLNMPNDDVQQPEESGFTDSSGTGEPSAVPEPAPETSAVEAGKQAPDFTLYDLEGNETSLSDYKGKLVFLNYWATWCPYCVEEMPDLQIMHEENDDLVVIGVNVRETKEQAEDFMIEGGFDFPVMLDEDGHIASLYLVNAMPSTFFLNSEGIILGYQPGMMNREQMEDILGQMRELEGQL